MDIDKVARGEKALINAVIESRQKDGKSRDPERDTSLYDDYEYQRHVLNECKRVSEVCYLLLYKAGEDGEVLEYPELLEKTLRDLSELPEDEKIELNLSEIQLLCLRCQEAFYEELQDAIEKMKRDGEL